MAEIINFPFPEGRETHQTMFLIYLWNQLGLCNTHPNEVKKVADNIVAELNALSDTELAQAIKRECPAILKPTKRQIQRGNLG